MSRLAQLRARREELLGRCAEQRAELAERIAQLRGRGGHAAQPGAQGAVSGAARHPLAWIAVLWGAMLIGRAREVLSLLLTVRSAVALVAHAVQLLRGFGGRRSPRPARAAAAEVTGRAERA